ncbi:MAG: glutathione S-transferase C-terminal domain-containing protein [Butyrivibrio sp.]|nr:glutathione S-transferase C-terminal domain-containing protein [Butyrivibrio sp.]MBR1643583.1 glutathione S-transferase C-terminal domain-containing protein [Butyrivibrio sp.]
MSYIVPFQSVDLFENTFKRQINKNTGEIENRKFVFDKLFGEGPDKLPVEADRYRLIWMPGCPHSNKAVITLRLLGLDRVISIGECGVLRDPRGWVFSEDIGEVDPVLKIHYLDDAYLKGDPEFTGRSTVPAIVDVTTGAVAQNDPVNIPKYFVRDWKKYHKENAPDLYPEELQKEIDEWSDFINKEVNAYGCGFARNQERYDAAFDSYFDALDTLEKRLSDRRFVNGDHITLSDIHLYVALIRFHINYHLVFGVNKKRLQDYPNLWGYTRDIYQTESFYEYTKLEWIKKHYQLSPHMRAKLGNVYGLVGTGPDNRELLTPTGREKLSKDPDNKFVYETSKNPLFFHNNVYGEKEYLEYALLTPIRKAGEATFQTDLERWAHQEEDAFKQIDKRLSVSRYLLGDKLSEADEILYRTLLRHDHIYYYQNKLNFAKSFDYPNIRRYVDDLKNIDSIANSIDIVSEKEQAFKELDESRNPYGLIFRGPEI